MSSIFNISSCGVSPCLLNQVLLARCLPLYLTFFTPPSPPPLQEWDRRGKPGGSFFKWLSTPEVQDLEGCPRHLLESDVVHYCRPEERVNYALRLEVTTEVRKARRRRALC